MSYYLVGKSTLRGEITIPSSKSQTLRAILFASFAWGKSTIRNYLPSPDTQAMIDACKFFGAKIDLFPDRLEVVGTEGKVLSKEGTIDVGNSGITLRFCSAMAALGPSPVILTGDESIRTQRPMDDLINGLSQLGVSVQSIKGNGKAPLLVQGPLLPGKTIVSGEDSQPVSALLIASAFSSGHTEIKVVNPGEKPWIGMTLDWMDKLDISYRAEDFTKYTVFGNSHYEGFDYTVPGDLSSSAFPLAAALITGSDLVIRNIDLQDPQGDKKLIEIFQKMGALIHIDKEEKVLYVKKGSCLQGVHVDMNDCIDGITILSVVACFAKGKTVICNAKVARQKECNRIQAIASELTKMRGLVFETDDGLIIQGSSLHSSTVDSYHDHRMAMSLAVAAMATEGTTKIGPTACIAKTFPTFYHDFKALGVCIEEKI